VSDPLVVLDQEIVANCLLVVDLVDNQLGVPINANVISTKVEGS